MRPKKSSKTLKKVCSCGSTATDSGAVAQLFQKVCFYSVTTCLVYHIFVSLSILKSLIEVDEQVSYEYE